MNGTRRRRYVPPAHSSQVVRGWRAMPPLRGEPMRLVVAGRAPASRRGTAGWSPGVLGCLQEDGSTHYFELGLHNESGASVVDTQTGIEQAYFEGHFAAA